MRAGKKPPEFLVQRGPIYLRGSGKVHSSDRYLLTVPGAGDTLVTKTNMVSILMEFTV